MLTDTTAPIQVAPLGVKPQDDHDVAGGSQQPLRMAALAKITSLEILPFMDNGSAAPSSKKNGDDEEVLKPYPFFYYKDYSKEVDPDPLYPLVPPGRVPNFPAKMHAIFSRPDLEDIIAWMPHGRSWRVLKPRDFELKVIPQYFDHAKYSSFVRQANGWGFRRIAQGRDQGSYYHPKFLRNLTHLCKTMKRLVKTAKKRPVDPNTEPDLFKISELHPLPEKPQDESIMLNCTMNGGPNARVPVFDGAQTFQNVMTANNAVAANMAAGHTSPDTQFMQEFTHIAPKQTNEPSTSPVGQVQQGMPSAPTVYLPPAAQVSPVLKPQQQGETKQVSSSSSAPGTFPFPPAMMAPFQANGMVMMPQFPGAPAPGSEGAASFAAGFAAATAFSQQHFGKLLQCMADGGSK